MGQSDVLDIIRSRDERGVFIRLGLSGKVRGMIYWVGISD